MGRTSLALLGVQALLAGCAPAPTRDLDVPAWSDDGFAVVEPPIRLPKTAAGHDAVSVVVRVPQGARIGVRFLPEQQRWVLVYPEGTTAARVERWDGMVADVRGTRVEAGGAERFFVLRPDGSAPALTGVEWPRGDAQAQREATRRLVELARDPAAGAHLARQNDCAGCHVHERAQSSGPGGPAVHRGTDAAGFFAPQTLLSDDAPLEDYKPRDPNLEDPFVSLRCGQHPAVIDRSGDSPTARCSDGSAPIAHLDLPAALQANDAHARRVCASRVALGAWLDDDARHVFATAFGECAASATP